MAVKVSFYYIALRAVIIVLLPSFITAEVCSDSDQSLCALMLKKTPEICGDPCLAKICKRSCGLCPLQCYDCTETTDATNCTTVTTCSDPLDYCYSVQTFTAHFTEAYRLGCGSRQTCLQYTNNKRTSVENGNKRASIEAGCCNSDRCNNKPPPILHIVTPTTSSSPGPTLDPNQCVNRDEEVCTALTLHMSNPCADDCIATKLCPHMCRKCFYCLDCYEVDDPQNCSETTVCGFGKECYGLEKLGSDFSKKVQLGCIDQTLCSQLERQPGHIFGKRNGEFNLRGECCIGDNCNAHHVTTTTTTTVQTTTTMTTKTTNVASTSLPQSNCPSRHSSCPPGFIEYQYSPNNGGKETACYRFDNHDFTKDEAETFCRRICANLLFAETFNEVHVLRNFMTSGTIEVFTDMERLPNNSWIHTHDNSFVHTQMVHNIHNRDYHSCATASYHYNQYHHTSATSFHAVDCDSLKKTLCKISLD